ncbi:MAG TPA: DivIVA domain-containing protein [Acidimicrobiales bacterium]|nr:DivIVA domain-containing protein [Acidimicrobiales bacterium]
MPDDRPNSPAISTSRVAANEIVRHTFLTVRRGFDPSEVRSYLELVARELQAWEQRDEDLRAQLAAAQEQAQHPVIDEASLTAALGQQSAQVLRNAHEEAARIALQAEQAAATLLREAQQQATEIMVQAESDGAERIAESELAASGVRQDTDRQTAEKLAAARADGAGLVDRAREQGRGMIDQAQAARRHVLTDMAHRRRMMGVQIEQFRAARDELAAAVLGVRDSVDRIVEELSRADDAAREAAADVARRQPLEPGDDELFAEAEVVVSGLELHEPPSAGAPGAPGAPTAPSGPPERSGAPDVVDEDLTMVVERIVITDIDEPRAAPSGAEPFDADAVEVETPKAAPTKSPAKPAPSKTASAKATKAAPPAAEAPTQVVPAAPVVHPTAADPVSVVPAVPPAPTDTVPAPGTTDAGGDENSVEDLFARLRAGRSEEPAAVPPATPAQGAVTPPTGTPPVLAPEDEPLGTPRPDDGTPDEEGGGVAADPVLAHRAELLDPVVTKLARRMKRTLQDDQNRLLDQLRAGSGTWNDNLLVTEDEQRRLYADAAVGDLADAAAAGMAFGRSESGAKGRPPKADPKVADALADALAGNIVALLRRRLTGPEGAGSSDDATERVGAAYREWRGERIERLVGDVALGAFSAGVLAATPPGTGVHWVLGGTGAGCADCDDNALAGDVAAGDEFPTGHKHPPAHAGCRCLVVPTPA